MEHLPRYFGLLAGRPPCSLKILDRLRLNLSRGRHALSKENIFAFRIFPLLEDQLIPEAVIKFPGKVYDPRLFVPRVAGMKGDLSLKDV